jgi:hypothetical protein
VQQCRYGVLQGVTSNTMRQLRKQGVGWARLHGYKA